MTRRVRSYDMETRTARAKLKPRGRPYYVSLGDRLHLGYRRGQRDGVWVVRRYLGNETYETETIAEADDHADANGVNILTFYQAQDVARGTPAKPKGGKFTIGDAVAYYLHSLEEKASWNDTRLRMKAYALPVFGTLAVDRLTADMLTKWHRDLAKAPRRLRGGTRQVDLEDDDTARKRKVSANRILGQLKAALNYAFRTGKVASDTEWRKVAPFKKVNRSRATFLKLAECKRLLNACDPEFRSLVRAALETGARYGELCRLRVSDYDPDNGKLYIATSKSGDSRYVTLTDDGQSFFDALTTGRDRNAPMFGRDWKPSQQGRPMKAACLRAKIDPPVGFHQLRHTWASLSIKSGLALQIIAKNLGHADTRMVERHYGHLDDDHVTQEIRHRAPRFGKVDTKVTALR